MRIIRKASVLGSVALLGAAFLTTGCVSNNVSRFEPDSMQAYTLKSQLKKAVALGNFSMLAKQDKNSIMCRLGGNIYLPNKMTYTDYIKHAFAETLIQANKYSTSVSGHHVLSANISNVDFNSFAGNWIIIGSMRVDHNAPLRITSKTKFGTSFDAMSACQNVATGFESAVSDFVNKTLSDRRLRKELNA